MQKRRKKRSTKSNEVHVHMAVPYFGSELWTMDYHNIVWRMWLFLICIYIWSFASTKFVLRLTMIASEISYLHLHWPPQPAISKQHSISNITLGITFNVLHKMYSYYYHFHLHQNQHISNDDFSLIRHSNFQPTNRFSISFLFSFEIEQFLVHQQAWIRLMANANVIEMCMLMFVSLNEIGLLSHTRHWHMDCIKETCPIYDDNNISIQTLA